MTKKRPNWPLEKIAATYCVAYLPVFLWLSLSQPLNAASLHYFRLLAEPLVVASYVWWLCGAYFAFGTLFRASLRDRIMTKLAFFQERDEREEIVVGRAARAMFLINVAFLVIAGLSTMVGVRDYSWTQDEAPQWDNHKTTWPVLAIPGLQENHPKYEEINTRDGNRIFVKRFALESARHGDRFYIFCGGPLFNPEIPAYFFAAAALEVLAFQLLARRIGRTSIRSTT